MPNFHIYLISSLPMLQFGMKPPFSFSRFIERCEGLIPDEEVALLGSLPSAAGEGQATTLNKWQDLDRQLRNELVKIRAVHKKIDPRKYLRGDEYVEPAIMRAAINAARQPSPLEAERLLDLERWRALEEMAVGHYFDLDSLIIFGLKLLILERWDAVQRADRPKLLEETLISSKEVAV